MVTQGSADPIDAEIARVNAATRAMINEYAQWGDKIVYENGNTLYMDLLDFVNFRIETADSCLLLIEHSKIADSLGLTRSLFENYPLFMLMCRGRNFIQLQDMSSLTESDLQKRHEIPLNWSRTRRGNGPVAATGRYGSIRAHSASVTSKRATFEFYQPQPARHRASPRSEPPDSS